MQLLHVFDKKDYIADMPRFTREAVRAVIIKDGKIALVKSETQGYYKFPGGGIESGESYIEALIRETREETGLNIIPDSVYEFGMIKEVRKGLYENEIFEQNSYYYFAKTDEVATDLMLDNYEAEEGYHLDFVQLAEAAHVNETLAGQMKTDFLYREAYVMRLLCLSRKTMDRAEWKRVTKREYSCKIIKSQDFKGAIGLLKLLEIRQPLVVDYHGKKFKIVDRNYKWLQFAFENECYWLTVMLDENDKIIQFYCDITFGNYLDPNGSPWFLDLFLDVVILPDGEIIVLDENELREALENNLINHSQYDLAYTTMHKFINEIAGCEKQLAAFCMKYYRVFEDDCQ